MYPDAWYHVRVIWCQRAITVLFLGKTAGNPEFSHVFTLVLIAALFWHKFPDYFDQVHIFS